MGPWCGQFTGWAYRKIGAISSRVAGIALYTVVSREFNFILVPRTPASARLIDPEKSEITQTITPKTKFFDPPPALPLMCIFAITAIVAQKTPRSMSPNSSTFTSLTGCLVIRADTCWERKVDSGRHERMMRLIEMETSERLKLLSAMFMVKDIAKRHTANISNGVVSCLGVYL